MAFLQKVGVLVGCTLLSLPAWADSYWSHNGSVVRLVAEENYRAFYYHKPSQKVKKLGVTKDTLLFEGYRQGNRYDGTAFAFPSSCGDEGLSYKVSGPVSTNQTKIVLKGTRLISCHSSKTKVDTLTFTYLYSD